jgi:hypothetical protein
MSTRMDLSDTLWKFVGIIETRLNLSETRITFRHWDDTLFEFVDRDDTGAQVWGPLVHFTPQFIRDGKWSCMSTCTLTSNEGLRPSQLSGVQRNSSNNLEGPLNSLFGWLVAGAGLFWEKSTAGWLLVAGLFWEKSNADWWLISRANRLQIFGYSNLCRVTYRFSFYINTFLCYTHRYVCMAIYIAKNGHKKLKW